MTAGGEPFTFLVSFHYYRTAARFQVITDAMDAAGRAGLDVRILVDSGAYSAHKSGAPVTVDDYSQWLRQVAEPEWGDRLVAAFTMDDLSSPTRSWRQTMTMVDRGHDVVPVVHMGEPRTVLDWYLDAGWDYVALGTTTTRGAPRLRWCADMIAHAQQRQPDARFHALGMGDPNVLNRLPWWTADAAPLGLNQGLQYAEPAFWDPHYRKVQRLDITRHGFSKRRRRLLYDRARMLRDEYGVDTAELEPPVHARTVAPTLARLCSQSAFRWQQYLRTVRPVTPPASRAQWGEGTHLAPVDAHPEQLANLIRVAAGLEYVDMRKGASR